jgi:hypothetical protein
VRELADVARIHNLMKALGAEAEDEGAAYLTGGATAVLLGCRATTIAVDLVLVPEHDTLLRAMPWLKDELRVNLELVSPGGFVPLAEGWQDRSLFVARVDGGAAPEGLTARRPSRAEAAQSILRAEPMEVGTLDLRREVGGAHVPGGQRG